LPDLIDLSADKRVQYLLGLIPALKEQLEYLAAKKKKSLNEILTERAKSMVWQELGEERIYLKYARWDVDDVQKAIDCLEGRLEKIKTGRKVTCSDISFAEDFDMFFCGTNINLYDEDGNELPIPELEIRRILEYYQEELVVAKEALEYQEGHFKKLKESIGMGAEKP
jgi:hypothetical protein